MPNRKFQILAIPAALILTAFLAKRLRDAGRELARSEERLRRMAVRMGRARRLEAAGRLAGSAAHDFNNLLTSINGYAELASSRLPAGHPAAAMLAEIRKAGDRAVAITGSLLELSRGRPDASGTPLPMAWRQVSVNPKEKATMPARAPEPPGKAREIVLVVDDDESIRHLAASVLRSEGHEVLEASGAREAMFLHEQHRGPIHTLLTDVIMPGRSGRELALDLQRLRPGMRTIFMSGYTGDILLKQGLETSRALFLGKPFTPAGLLAKMAEAETLSTSM
jgi:CheY-like chemotaxis protein